MEKLDYSDINKFLASLGVVLVGVSFLLPYIYLKEDFGFLVKKSDFNTLLEVSQNIFLTKQYYLEKLQFIIPFLSLITFISGVTSFYIGIKRWNSNQGKLDQKLDTEIEKLSYETLSLRPLSNKEKERKIIEEDSEALKIKKTEKSLVDRNKITEFVKQALAIEKEIGRIYTDYRDDNFEVWYQQKIGNKFNLDILLKSLDKKFLDGIIEIKLLRNSDYESGLGLNRALDTINSFIGYYTNSTGNNVIPVLLIIIEDGENQGVEIKENLKKKIFDYSRGISDLDNLIVEILYKSEIQKYKPAFVFNEIKKISKKINLNKALKAIENEYTNANN